MARSSWLQGRTVAGLLSAVLLIVQAVMPVAAQDAEFEVLETGNGIVSGEVKDRYASGRAIVTVHNLRRFWVAVEPADHWGSMTFEPAPITGDHGDLGGAWATIAVIPPLGTAAYDLSVDPRAGGSQSFRVHYDGTSAGGLGAVGLNVVQLVGNAVGGGELKGGAAAVATAMRTLTQVPGWAEIVRKNQGDALAPTDLPAVVRALLGTRAGRQALRQALKAVGLDVGLPALRKIASGVSAADVLLFLDDLGKAVAKGQYDGSVAFYVPGTGGSVREIDSGESQRTDAEWFANANLVEAWTSQFGGSSYDSVSEVSVDADGNVYAAGATVPDMPDGSRASVGFVRKYGPDGEQIWTSGEDRLGGASALSIDDRGDIYVAGFVGDEGPSLRLWEAPRRDATLLKLDRDGHVAWQRSFGSEVFGDQAFALVVGPQGRIYVAGVTMGSLPQQQSAGEIDGFVQAYERSGDLIWSRQFGSAGSDGVSDIAVDRTSRVYVAGSAWGSLPGQDHYGESDAYLLKLRPNGVVAWVRQFGTPSHDGASLVRVDERDNIYVAGDTFGELPDQAASGGENDAYVRKYGKGGRERWTRQFGSSGVDEVLAGTVVAGHLILGGASRADLVDDGASSPGDRRTETDAFVRSYALDGKHEWTMLFGSELADYGLAADYVQSIVATGDGLVVGGTTSGSLSGQPASGDYDAFVRKYVTEPAVDANRVGSALGAEPVVLPACRAFAFEDGYSVVQSALEAEFGRISEFRQQAIVSGYMTLEVAFDWGAPEARAAIRALRRAGLGEWEGDQTQNAGRSWLYLRGPDAPPYSSITGSFGAAAREFPDRSALRGELAIVSRSGSPVTPSEQELTCMMVLERLSSAGYDVAAVEAQGIDRVTYFVWQDSVNGLEDERAMRLLAGDDSAYPNPVREAGFQEV